MALSAPLLTSLYSAGASLALSAVTGLASLDKNVGGLATVVQNPLTPKNIIYGLTAVGGARIYFASNNNTGTATTSSNKQLHLVNVIASHPCAIGSAGVWKLRIDGKVLELTPNGNGYGYSSYSPTQQTSNIVSISRTDGLVTVTLASPISGLDGAQIFVKNIHTDNTLNGVFICSQPDPLNNSVFNWVSGGADITVTGSGLLSTTFPDYGNKVYIEWLNGNHTQTFHVLAEAGTAWNSSSLCLGNTLCYIQLGWDSSVWSQGMPNMDFVLEGKNTVYDPRTGTTGYTNNAALCIADYLMTPTLSGGFGRTIDDIDIPSLIVAANICDEQVPLAGAGGGTESRYTLNTNILLTEDRGNILTKLLTAMAGRISIIEGKVHLFAGAFVAPTLSLTIDDLVGPISYNPVKSIRDKINYAKGSYSGDPANNYQQADIPAYTQDTDHGFTSNQYLLEDGQILIGDYNLPCTSSNATAQRLLKIAMLKSRRRSLTLTTNLRGYQAACCDTIEFTYPRFSWVNKLFEVTGKTFVVQEGQDGEGPSLAVQLSLQECDSSDYDWTTEEQLSINDAPLLDAGAATRNVVAPYGLVLYCGPGGNIGGVTYPSTVASDISGIKRSSLYAAWNVTDAFTVDGGQVEVQYQVAGSDEWTTQGIYSGFTNAVFIDNVSQGSNVNVQVRCINNLHYSSDWVQEGPILIETAVSELESIGILPNVPFNSFNDVVIDSVATSPNTATIRIYGISGIGTSWNFYNGSTTVSEPSANITGMATNTTYIVALDSTSSSYQTFTNYASSIPDKYIPMGYLTTVYGNGSGGTTGGDGGIKITGGTGGGSGGTTGGGSRGTPPLSLE